MLLDFPQAKAQPRFGTPYGQSVAAGRSREELGSDTGDEHPILVIFQFGETPHLLRDSALCVILI
jgi:hypothetical protein